MTINTTIIAKGDNSARLCQILHAGKVLSTPTYFPAISSAKSRFPFYDLLVFLAAHEYPRILISSYDLSKLGGDEKEETEKLLTSYIENGNFLFLDSGGYESYWLRDLKWSFDLYRAVVERINFDFYTSYDYLFDGKENDAVKGSAFWIEESKKIARNKVFIPIIHGNASQNILNAIENFLNSYEDPKQIVAIPERDCGVLLSERAKMILKARNILNEYDERIILHILGCGNPISMGIYSYCGADSFDSIDWMRIFIDRHTLGIYSHSNSELVKCNCKICTKSFDPYMKIFLHNLVFYQEFTLHLQKMIQKGTLGIIYPNSSI